MSDQGLHCLSMLFWQATSVQYFRISTEPTINILAEICYSKTCVKQPLKNRQNKGLNDNW